MTDATTGGAPQTASQDERLGAHAATVADAQARLASENIVARIWQKDAGIWKSEEAHAKTIRNALGWLEVTSFVRERQSEIDSFISKVRDDELRYAVLLGMGGSSLCPEVLRRTFGRRGGGLELHVLDTTDPDTISHTAERIDLARTLFIVASKSGTTIEPLSLFEYFYNEVRERVGDQNAGRHFIAITDPGTPLETTARERGFRRVFSNPADIGGRYSALSLFGVVPAALIGLDVDKFLARAESAVAACRPEADQSQNHAARLGCAMGALALRGRDKLTLVTDESISSLGLWIEQLIAESTGKEGKGIVPVAGEPLGAPEVYGDDRLFVVVQAGELTDEDEQRLAALEAAGHPVIRRRLADTYDLAGEFFAWEFATAVAGWQLQINPFDQPNVQAAKNLTGEMLKSYERDGGLPTLENRMTGKGLTLYPPQKTRAFTGTEFVGNPVSAEGDAMNADGIDSDLAHFLAEASEGDYIALLAYIEATPEHDEMLTAIRVALRDRLRVATTSGYGPRYLHSTGQLHKGAPAHAVFLLITDNAQTDLAIPGAPYTFATLEAAQALGDFSALTEAAPPLMRVNSGADGKQDVPRVLLLHLGADTDAGLRRLSQIADRATRNG